MNLPALRRTIDAPKKLLELLSLWPHDLYNSAVVVELLQQKLGDYEKEQASATATASASATAAGERSVAVITPDDDATEDLILRNKRMVTVECLAVLLEKSDRSLESIELLLKHRSV